jgi:uncharacterized phiE125 gp8 family phage protein
MGLMRLTTTPSPVTLEELRSYLRISGNDDDVTLAMLLDSATAWVEEQTTQMLRTTLMHLTLDSFPKGREIRLPSPTLATCRTKSGILWSRTSR